VVVRPETVIGWHRKGFRLFWTWKSGRTATGRPAKDAEIRKLVVQMANANSTWGAPRIHGELLKLGIVVSERTVSRYMPPQQRRPPSQTWRTFLKNHVDSLVAVDFFVVPTATFRILYGFVVMGLKRRRVIHVNVTANPTAEWTALQIRQAFPWDTAPRYLQRDHDSIFSRRFRVLVATMNIDEVITAPRSPWQNPYVERLIGSIRRELLDCVIVVDEAHLRRLLRSYFSYYHCSRTHLSLHKDAPEPRPIQAPETGSIVALPQVGGLYHRYERIAA
jgi:transposase InsO family protein